MVVYTRATGAFRKVAERIANVRDEEVSNNLDEVLVLSEPVIYVDRPEHLQESTLLSLQRRLNNKGPAQGGFCVITGYTAEQALTLYEREKSDNSRDCLVLHNQRPEVDDDRSVVLDRDTASVDRLQALSGSLRSLSIVAAGWPIHVFLADGLLCGVPESQHIKEYDEPMPYCIEEDKANCPLSDNTLRAECIDAEHILMTSCASMIPNSPSGLPVHVGLGLLNGCTSLIGSYRPAPSIDQEALLHRCLLEEGYNVIERTYLLNRNAAAMHLKAAPYIPFGRPNAGTGNSGCDYAVSAVLDGDVTRIHIEDVDTYIIDLTVEGDVTPTGDDYFIRSVNCEHKSLYYTAFSEGESVRLLVYSGSRLPDSLEIVLDTSYARREDRTVLARSLENGEGHRRLGLLNSEINQQLEHLLDHLLSDPDQRLAERYDLCIHHDIANEVDERLNDLSQVQAQLIDHLVDGRYLFENYLDRGVEAGAYAAATYCGCGRRLFAKQIRDATGAVPRTIGICPYCGYVCDVPSANEEFSYPLLDPNSVEWDGRRASLMVTFENPTNHRMQARIRSTVLGSEHNTVQEQELIKPIEYTDHLDPSESISFNLTFNAESLPDNRYQIMTYVVGNLDVYVGMRSILAGDSTGSFPDRFR